jgi:hypothetical protein
MTHPIDALRPDPRSWRLILDEGEAMEVRLAERPDDQLGPMVVALFMSADRAADLSDVVGTYTRIAAIMHGASQVSGTEESLQRGLMDAARAAKSTLRPPNPTVKVSDGARLKAIELLQAARPELTHSAAVAIIDAAAWWIKDDMFEMAADLLAAIHPDAGMSVYSALLDWPSTTSIQAPA